MGVTPLLKWILAWVLTGQCLAALDMLVIMPRSWRECTVMIGLGFAYAGVLGGLSLLMMPLAIRLR